MMRKVLKKINDDVYKILFREFILYKTIDTNICIYQNDLMRIIKILESIGSNTLAKKLRLIIFLRDYKENTITDFKTTFKGDIKKKVLSIEDYLSIEHDNKKIEKVMEDFYEKNKK